MFIAKRPQRLSTVLTKDQVKKLIANLNGVYALMAGLICGSGMRLMECLRLRVKDVDAERNIITIREGKGAKDRVAPLPEKFKAELIAQLNKAKVMHRKDLDNGYGGSVLFEGI